MSYTRNHFGGSWGTSVHLGGNLYCVTQCCCVDMFPGVSTQRPAWLPFKRMQNVSPQKRHRPRSAHGKKYLPTQRGHSTGDYADSHYADRKRRNCHGARGSKQSDAANAQADDANGADAECENATRKNSRCNDSFGANTDGQNSTRSSLVQRFDVTIDRKSTRLNSSHSSNSYAVFCL